MPVIRTLGNPGFRDRHWENVSNIVGFPVKGGSNLFQILDMGLDEYVSKFEKIRYWIVSISFVQRVFCDTLYYNTNVKIFPSFKDCITLYNGTRIRHFDCFYIH